MENIYVQFRKFKDLQKEVIAVFPYEIEGQNTVNSYMHVGQHGGAIWNINTFTKPANESEYKYLLQEIKSIYNDCNVIVIKKRSHKKYLAAYYEYLNSRK